MNIFKRSVYYFLYYRWLILPTLFTLVFVLTLMAASKGLTANASEYAPGTQLAQKARKPRLISAHAGLDEAAIYFKAKTQGLYLATECFPIHINRPNDVNIMYLFCSKTAYENSGKAFKLTDEFSASARLVRRVNFWRQVYALWSEDQYVLHAAKYPEVVFEIGDASFLPKKLNWRQKQTQVRKTLISHRGKYKQILRKMHRLRRTPEKFTPAMRRISFQMQHITDDEKFVIAASNIRIQRGQREPIAKGLSASTRYMHAIKKEFAQQGMPEDLAKLAFLESSFNIKAYSKVGAAGVYQIMPATGRQYMRIKGYIDERRDPIKSARAAAKLLRLNYKILGKWPLAVSAYNHGANGIKKAVRRTNSDQIEDLIERYNGSSFGFASKNFYAEFLAILATVKDADLLYPDITKLAPLRYDDIRMKRATRISTLKKQHQLTTEIISVYNPDISKRLLWSNGYLPRGYVLKIPQHAPITSIMNTSAFGGGQ